MVIHNPIVRITLYILYKLLHVIKELKIQFVGEIIILELVRH